MPTAVGANNSPSHTFQQSYLILSTAKTVSNENAEDQQVPRVKNLKHQLKLTNKKKFFFPLLFPELFDHGCRWEERIQFWDSYSAQKSFCKMPEVPQTLTLWSSSEWSRFLSRCQTGCHGAVHCDNGHQCSTESQGATPSSWERRSWINRVTSPAQELHCSFTYAAAVTQL